MINPLNVAENERETVRVFALDLPAAEAEALAAKKVPNGAPPPLAALLGLDMVDFTHVEAFPASNLKGLGLAGYITEGLGVAEDDLRPDAPMLNRETGYIVIYHARAFSGAPVTLTPKAPLRHLGTYSLAQAAPPTATPPAPPGDSPAEAVPTEPTLGPPPRLPRALILLALIGAAVVVLLGAFLLGGSGQ